MSSKKKSRPQKKTGNTRTTAPISSAPAFVAKPGTLKQSSFRLTPSPLLHEWLLNTKSTIMITTYQSGQVLILGLNENGSLAYTSRTFEHAMGIACAANSLHLSTLYQIWHFENILPKGELQGNYDALFTPRTSHILGHMALHDLAIEDSGRLVFVNTKYNCLGELADGFSFRPIWKPDWISEISAGDRCHLNGLALRDGVVRYVTSVSRSNERDGWRKNRNGSGVIWDVTENRLVTEGLAMPHSPRWHHGKLYFINSGSGYLCSANPETGDVTEIGFVPGFARGLALQENHALIGTSQQRANRTFSDLPLENTLKFIGIEGVCALHLVNLETGVIDHWMRIEGDIQELYDVCVIPNFRFANVIGFMNDDVKNLINIPKGELMTEGRLDVNSL
ncbi:MAG: TIGR03032 family protein [Sumerlaeia bacterium]